MEANGWVEVGALTLLLPEATVSAGLMDEPALQLLLCLLQLETLIPRGRGNLHPNTHEFD